MKVFRWIEVHTSLIRFLCWLTGGPEVGVILVEGPYQGKGDYADQWAICERCNKLCHRDAHWTGDWKWRHV